MDIVVSKQVHKLNPSFENQWDLINKRTLDTKYYENLYEVAHGLGRSGEMGYSTGVRINGASNKYGAKVIAVVISDLQLLIFYLLIITTAVEILHVLTMN